MVAILKYTESLGDWGSAQTPLGSSQCSLKPRRTISSLRFSCHATRRLDTPYKMFDKANTGPQRQTAQRHHSTTSTWWWVSASISLATTWHGHGFYQLDSVIYGRWESIGSSSDGVQAKRMSEDLGSESATHVDSCSLFAPSCRIESMSKMKQITSWNHRPLSSHFPQNYQML